ncbi:MAG TPA: circadian clock KaiB family protein [Planctomycetota bacterium]|nr:circadian clock KaiB family protein [Planctomycetota bacterium]
MPARRLKRLVNAEAEAFDGCASAAARARYVLRLYVAGDSPASRRALANIEAICQEHLAGRYQLEVVDIYQNPVLARGDRIIAVPTLIRELPRPLRRFIGDLSQKEKLLVGLDIRPAGR